MSLQIITDLFSIPKENFIFDVESMDCVLEDNNFTRFVIGEIDQGKYLNKISFLDRFGYKLYADCLSTTSKIYLLVYNEPDLVVNGSELGWGSGKPLLKLSNGTVYIPQSHLPYLFDFNYKDKIDICLDGKLFTDYDTFLAYMQGDELYD